MEQVLKILKDEFKLAMMLSGDGICLVVMGTCLVTGMRCLSPFFVYRLCKGVRHQT